MLHSLIMRWKPYTLTLCLSWLLSSLLAASDIPFDIGKEGLWGEEWSVLRMNGQRVGYVHSYQVREGDVVRTTMVQFLKIGRAGSTVEMRSTQVQEEALDGKPLAFSIRQQMGQVPTEVHGKIADGVLRLRQVQYGKETQSEVAWEEGPLMTWGVQLQTKDIELAEGKKYELVVFLPDVSFTRGVRTLYEVVGREEIEWRGSKLDLWKTKITLHVGAAKVEAEEWTDGQKVYRSLVPMGLITLETILADSAEALADFAASELLVSTMLEVTGIEGVAKAREATYEVSVKGEDSSLLKDLFPSDGNQTVVRSGGQESAIQLRVHPQQQVESAEPAPGEEYLATSFYLNYEDEAVRQLVQQVTELRKLPVGERAMALTQWVNKALEEKNYDTGFATASEVARNMQGDCTEHAVLLAAMGRALGIPSRCAYGLALVAEKHNQSGWMGFHMWTQFYVDGKWIDYDAALFSLANAPVRINMGTSAMQKDVLADFSVRVMQVVGLLEVKLLGVSR